MAENNFDKIIKDKLQDYEAPFNPDDWLLFSQELEAEEVAEVDQVAKDSLDTYTPEGVQSDWALMSLLLDSDLPDPLDETAKETLESYQPAELHTDWVLMSSMLDEAGFIDEVDIAAQKAFHQLEKPFQASDWDQMQAHLVQNDRMKHNLVVTKTIELFLMAFAIWTIGLFLPLGKEKSNKSLEKPTMEQTLPSKNKPNDRELPPIDKNTPMASWEDPENYPSTLISSANITLSPVGYNSLKSIENQISISQISTRTPELLSFPYVKDIPKHQSKNQINFVAFKSIPLNQAPRPEVVPPIIPAEKRGKVLSIRFAPEWTSIQNSGRSVARKTAVMRYSAGVSSEVQLSKKLALSLGLMFNKKTFTARTQEEFNAMTYTLTSVKEVDFNIIQVPVHLQYDVLQLHPVRVYVKGGGSANFVMTAQKGAKRVSLSGGVNNLADNVNGFVDPRQARAEGEVGILNGGGLINNHLITADVGIGVELKLRSNLAVFIEPIYQHGLNRIGEDDDQFKTLAFSVGSRINL